MTHAPQPDLSTCILFESKTILVLDKPSGVPTAGDTLEQPGSAQHALMKRAGRMVWAVHQLDRDTSGANLFTLRKSLVAPLTEALKRGRKTYLAITSLPPQGLISSEHAHIREPLAYSRELARHAVDPKGKPAHSEVRVLATSTSQDAALLEVTLHTGRTHQIRAHLASLGISILGDARYAESAYTTRAPRQALHAWQLTLNHDALPLAMPITAPLPADLRAILDANGLQLPDEKEKNP